MFPFLKIMILFNISEFHTFASYSFPSLQLLPASPWASLQPFTYLLFLKNKKKHGVQFVLTDSSLSSSTNFSCLLENPPKTVLNGGNSGGHILSVSEFMLQYFLIFINKQDSYFDITTCKNRSLTLVEFHRG